MGEGVDYRQSGSVCDQIHKDPRSRCGMPRKQGDPCSKCKKGKLIVDLRSMALVENNGDSWSVIVWKCDACGHEARDFGVGLNERINGPSDGESELNDGSTTGSDGHSPPFSPALKLGVERLWWSLTNNAGLISHVTGMVLRNLGVEGIRELCGYIVCSRPWRYIRRGSVANSVGRGERND